MQEKSTINLQEVKKFANLSSDWWDEGCKSFKMLHQMNSMRIKYILNQVGSVKGLNILDVGCGGGILSIPLARVGGNVTGIDPAEESILVAQKKAEAEVLKVDFTSSSIENFNKTEFDMVLLMDVIEHVEDARELFCQVNLKLKNQGLLIISTINKTLFSKLFVKFLAENVLGLVPQGTHDFNKFISPEEILSFLPNFKLNNIKGFTYNPITKNFKMAENYKMNYFATFCKLS